MKIQRAVIFSDGMAKPNPGQAAIGVIIKDEKGKLVTSISRPIGLATNNQAEYLGVITALEEAIKLGIGQIEIRSDSELVVRQLRGQYRVKNASLKPLHQKIRGLLSQFQSYTIVHIPREQNEEADNLADKGLK